MMKRLGFGFGLLLSMVGFGVLGMGGILTLLLAELAERIEFAAWLLTRGTPILAAGLALCACFRPSREDPGPWSG